MDSGATCHITSRKEVFLNLDGKHREKIGVANGQTLLVVGRGTVLMNFKNENDDTIKIRIDDVLYAPQVGGSLLSVRRLIKKGFKINFTDDKCEIQSGDSTKQYVVADLHKNLYRLRQSQSMNIAQAKQHKCAHE